MKRSRFSEAQIIGILKEHQAGHCQIKLVGPHLRLQSDNRLSKSL
jgi:hypothetical protein